MGMIFFLVFFLLLWYMSALIQTYVYLSKNGIYIGFLDLISVPFVLFLFHFSIFRKEKRRKTGLKFLLLYFTKYKLSIIFLTEIILENIAMTEVFGQSPHISKTMKIEREEKSIKTIKDIFDLSAIKKIFKLQETIVSFEELLANT